MILATTTSTQDSGLLDVLIPIFEKKTGYTVKPVAVGTGAALAMGEQGEADVLLVHAPKSEEAVVESGAAINRQLVMHNDFIICGPADDPPALRESHQQLRPTERSQKPEQLLSHEATIQALTKRKKKYGQQPGLNLQETGTLRPVQE